MRGFIVLCLSAVALAAPQGYNYNPAGGVGSLQGGGISTFSGSSGGPTNAGGFFQGGAIQQPSFGGHYQPQQQQQQQPQYHQQQYQQQPQHQQAIVSKRFFIHSAPEDVEEEYKEKLITVGVPRKNYNVVFIKSPAKPIKKTSIKISPAVNEEKTVIYVLNKKTDASDVHAEILEHPTSTTKPEVFFIKYKTPEEAAHAQQEIQAQYDALGGSSQVTDEGVAPVTSVIGSLGDPNAVDGGSHGGAGIGGGAHGGAGIGGGPHGGAGIGGGPHGGAGIGGGAGVGGGVGGGIGGGVGGNAGLGGGLGGGSFVAGGGPFIGGGGVVGGGHGNNAYLPPNFK